MITPKYAIKIEDGKKNTVATAYTNQPWFASLIITGIISSQSFKDFMKEGCRIVAESTENEYDNNSYPEVDAYENGDI